MFSFGWFRQIDQKLDLLLKQQREIMATQAELVTQVQNVTTELVKIQGETTTLLAKIADLTAIIAAGGTVTPELQAAVDALTAQAKIVDDLVPDAP